MSYGFHQKVSYIFYLLYLCLRIWWFGGLLYYYFLLNYGHWMEVLVYHFGFDLYPPDDQWGWAPFMCINQWSSSCKVLVDVYKSTKTVCVLLLYLQGFFTYSEHRPFLGYTCCKYLLLPCCLPLYSPDEQQLKPTTSLRAQLQKYSRLPRLEENVSVLNSQHFMDIFREFFKSNFNL